MKRMLMLAAALAVGSSAFGQAPPPPSKPIEQATTTYRAKQVLGMKVYITGETGIGTVEDLVFDDAGNMDYLIVDNGGKLITLPWEAAKLNFEKKAATVAITPEQYKVIPTYTVTTYPSFYTPTYRTEVYKYYGLTPRDLRRLKR